MEFFATGTIGDNRIVNCILISVKYIKKNDTRSCNTASIKKHSFLYQRVQEFSTY